MMDFDEILSTLCSLFSPFLTLFKHPTYRIQPYYLKKKNNVYHEKKYKTMSVHKRNTAPCILLSFQSNVTVPQP